MVVSKIELYELLKERFGNAGAEAFVEILENKVAEKFVEAKQVLATKEDIANLRAEMKSDKADVIKWMFIFWIGQLAAFIAIAKFFLSKGSYSDNFPK